MKYHLIILLFFTMACNEGELSSDKTVKRPDYAIVIHGGAGTITREGMTPAMEAEYLAALDLALTTGEEILKEGKPAIMAVEAAIRVMEDSPLFNAGKGAVFTHEGKNELDASIMDGASGKAGAVGGLTIIKNPISAAIAVMNQSEHVMMVGKGAEDFCRVMGIELVDPTYFFTDRRWKALQQAILEDSTGVLSETDPQEKKRGTVGCVAMDKDGNIVAGTSTGGMTNKKFGRIGDSPIIGAGTYADNKSCGVSCTGHGEHFIRNTVARDVAAMMEYGGKSCQEASAYLIHQKLMEKGGEGGLIAIDKRGNVVMEFNSEGMYRGFAVPGQRMIKIYKD
ncbi:MAG: isoaspartyl peptidase/L-asparaginase [Saprospiraceae bacterium]|nr:isoaspartyl peptidase/L-asparaginase [Saprospiraceae bacterium]